MTSNTTTGSLCTDPRVADYWCIPFFGAAHAEDSELLAAVHQWRHVRTKIDAALADHGRCRDALSGLMGQLDGLQGKLASHTPV